MRMRIRNIRTFLAVLFIFSMPLACTSCSLRSRDITIVDVKIVTAIDEKLMPVKITNSFPRQTSKVACWIQWRNAKINTQIMAKWHYITDDIHVLDHIFNIPKKDGTGGVVLSMPNGKYLPSGLYKVELLLGKRVLKSLTFRVE